jgi:hypothetical protein
MVCKFVPHTYQANKFRIANSFTLPQEMFYYSMKYVLYLSFCLVTAWNVVRSFKLPCGRHLYESQTLDLSPRMRVAHIGLFHCGHMIHVSSGILYAASNAFVNIPTFTTAATYCEIIFFSCVSNTL